MKKRIEDGNETMTNHNRLWRRAVLISMTAAAAAVTVICCAAAALRHQDSLKPGKASYFYVNGMRTEWSADMKLMRKDGVTVMDEGRKKYEFQEFPLVLADEDTIILQKSCCYNRIADERIFRLDYFTAVSRDEEGIRISRRDKENRGGGGFIYDNNDTYIFLEPVTLSWEGDSRQIEPMTIIQVSYMDYLELYGPGIEPFAEQVSTDEVVAEFEDGRKVNLSTDRYYMQNGVWRLLFLPLEGLSEMETGGIVDEEAE